MSTDTNWEIIETDEFKSAGFKVTWRLTASETSNRYPRDEWRNVYIPSDYAKEWDNQKGATHALGSRHGGYTYCQIVTTGRKITQSPSGVWGLRCRITMNFGGVDGVQVISGWCVEIS